MQIGGQCRPDWRPRSRGIAADVMQIGGRRRQAHRRGVNVADEECIVDDSGLGVNPTDNLLVTSNVVVVRVHAGCSLH